MFNLATSKMPLLACLLPVAILKAKTSLRNLFHRPPPISRVVLPPLRTRPSSRR